MMVSVFGILPVLPTMPDRFQFPPLAFRTKLVIRRFFAPHGDQLEPGTTIYFAAANRCDRNSSFRGARRLVQSLKGVVTPRIVFKCGHAGAYEVHRQLADNLTVVNK